MSDRTAYLEVAYSDCNVFIDSKQEDLVIYTDTSDQGILIGTIRSNVAAVTIRNNNVFMASNLSVQGNVSFGSSNVANVIMELNTTDALLIPQGTTAQRPVPAKQGHVRYNTTINTFEGYGAGNAWGSLGGVKDTNQDTYISAENYPTSNDDILRFYNSNNETMRIMTNGRIGISNQAPSERLEVSGGNAKFNSNIFVMQRLGIAGSNPTEAIDVSGSIKASTNIYAMSKLCVANSNPTEILDVTGNAKISSNLYNMARHGIATSNPTEALDIVGNAKISSNLYTIYRIGVANSNPSESVDVAGNIKASSNIYSMARFSVANSNPTEALDVTGNIKASSNIYSMVRFSVANSNPTETVDITGNTKVSNNIYAMSRIGIATSNPQVALEVNATDAVLLPKGTTVQRPSIPQQGHVRYNIDINTFEGYGAGNAWGSLGGVKDTNQDTYISAESFPTSNDDILRFYNSNIENMRLTKQGNLGIGTQSPSQKLHVQGNAIIDSNIYVSGHILPNSNEIYDLGNSNNQRFRDLYLSGNSIYLGNVKIKASGSSIIIQDSVTSAISSTATAALTLSNYGQASIYTSNNNIGINTQTPTSIFEINGTDAVLIPKGTTIQRPAAPKQGQIRYNVDINIFEGYGAGNAWGSLGGVKDTNQDTYVSAESYPTSNDDTIRFLNSNNETLRVMPSGRIGISNQAPSERLELSGGNAKFNSNVYILSRLGIANSNPTEPLDTTGNIKASANIYAMSKLAVANSNPTEALDTTGNIKASANIYAMSKLAVANSNPTEALDTTGNIKASANIYAMSKLAVANSNPTEALDATGNIKASSNMYALSRIGIANTNPTESLDAIGNIKASANIYGMGKIGVATSNPTEVVDIVGNMKVSSNFYNMARHGVATSNPTEALDVIGNAKVSNNLFVLSRQGIANSNPTEALDIIGNIKASSNVYALAKLGVVNSNPTEAIDVTGNAKVSNNLFVMGSLGIATSNPSVSLEVNGNAKVNSNIEVLGNLTIRGTTTVVDSTTVTIADNIIRINNGAAFNASLQAGMEINRGVGYSNFYFVFDEASKYFKVGQAGSIQVVATRDDMLPTNAIAVYDMNNFKYTGCNLFVYSNNNLGIGIAGPSEALEVIRNVKASSNIYAMVRLGVANSNPTESIDTIGNIKASANVYAMAKLGIATSNPTEALDTTGNIKASANIYAMNRVGAGNSNPTETIDATGNIKASANMYAMAKLGVATSTPAEVVEVIGNTKVSSNIYALSRLAIANSNPTEALDTTGNIKASANIYAMNRLGVATSNPVEVVDVVGNVKVSSNVYAVSRIGAGTTNPTETIDATGNVKASLNVYAMTKLGVATSNPTEIVDIVGNTKLSSNLYALSRISVANSNPTEAIDVIGNVKVSSNLYAFNRIGLATSNPTEALDVMGNMKASANIYAMVKFGVATSNPSESGDILGNLKVSSNIYNMARHGIATSNPTEALDVVGNTKISNNLYALNRIGVATSNPQVALEVNSTDAILLPKGTTAQRPSVPSQGHVRYNTDINTFEGYGAGNSWGSLGGVKDTNQDTYISAESYPTSNDDTIRFLTSNNEVMRIMPTGRIGISNQAPLERLELSGGNARFNSNVYVMQNLAIGKSNPSFPLDIFGNSAFDGSITSTKYLLSRGLQVKKRQNPYVVASSGSGVQFGLSNDTLGGVFYISSNDPLNYYKFMASNLEILRLTGNGFLGVGTSNPSERIQAAGKIYTTTQFLSQSNDSASAPSFSFKENSNTGIFHATTDTLGFSTAGTERVRITSAGYMGIGTTSTITQPLSVSGNILAGIIDNTAFGFDSTQNARMGIVKKAGLYPVLASSSNSPLIFGTLQSTDLFTNISTSTLSEWMRISATGSVGINTSSPAYTLDVNGTINATCANAGIAFQGTNGSLTNGQFIHAALGFSATNCNAAVIKYNHYGAGSSNYVQFGIWGNNNITCTAQSRVGINSTNPQYTLDVTGTIRANASSITGLLVDGGSSHTNIAIVNSTGGSTAIGLASITGQYSTDAAANDLVFRNASTNGRLLLQSGTGVSALTINSNNYIGIGTVSPAAPLSVQGGNNTGTLKILSSSGNAGDQWWLGFCHSGLSTDGNDRARIGVNIVSGGAGRLFFTTGLQGSQTERMRIDESGNIGIGTTAPSYKLDVAGDINLTGRFYTQNYPLLYAQDTTYYTSTSTTNTFSHSSALSNIGSFSIVGTGPTNYQIPISGVYVIWSKFHTVFSGTTRTTNTYATIRNSTGDGSSNVSGIDVQLGTFSGSSYGNDQFVTGSWVGYLQQYTNVTFNATCSVSTAWNYQGLHHKIMIKMLGYI